MAPKRITTALIFSSILFISINHTIAATKAFKDLSGADIMPDFVAAYAEITSPAALIDTVNTHPIYQRLMKMEVVKEAMNTPDLRKLQLASKLISAQLQMDLTKTAKELTGEGIYVGLDVETEIWVAASKAKSEDKLNEIIDTILDLVQLDALNKKHSALNQYQYRQVEIYSGRANKAYLCVLGPWLIVSNKKEGIEKILDLMIDQPTEALAHDRDYQRYRKTHTGQNGQIGFAFARTHQLQKFGIGQKYAQNKPDHPFKELLFGVLQESYRHATTMGVGIQLNSKTLSLSLEAPFDHKKLSKGRDYAYRTTGGGAFTPVTNDKTLFAMTTYRDLAGFWNNADTLFNENIAADMAQKDSELSTLFGGQNFSSETLPSMEPGMQFLAAQHEPLETGPTPAIKLPAFALIGNLKQEKQQQRFQIAFQSLISFLNIDAGQKGRPAMMISNEKINGSYFMTGSYMNMGMNDTKNKASSAPIYYNFTPTLALHGKKIIISSTRAYAQELMNQLAKSDIKTSNTANTLARLNGANTYRILKANFEHLVAQQIIEEGKSESRARQDMNILLALTKMVKEVELTYDHRVSDTRMTVNIHFNQE